MQFEITIKEYTKINETIELLKKFNIKDICITQKLKHINNVEVANQLLNSIPDLKITLNYSVALNYFKDFEKTYSSFIDFVDRANQIGINSFLIVSGTPRRLSSSIDILNRLKFRENGGNKFYCAFNPFLTNYIADDELERLRFKFASKVLAGVYFQLGDDLLKLKSGIKNAKAIAKDRSIYGSVLIPNEFVLNSLKFRPWNGVKYSEDFLNNMKFADSKTVEILKLYRSNGVEPLLDVIPFNSKNLIGCKRFF